MILSIVHLSDIHICEEKKFYLKEQAKKIAEAIYNRNDEETNLIIIVTGDIAFSGKESEYELAKEYFDILNTRLKGACKTYNLLFTPGNHDCDFSEENSIRPILIGNITKEHNVDSNIINLVTDCQSNYRKFDNNNSISSKIIDGKLIKKAIVNFDEEKVVIQFNLINTAWMSSLHETKNIYMPINIEDLRCEEIDDENFSNLIVTAYHHPSSWLDSESDCKFRQNSEQISNIILSGHEHCEDEFIKSRKTSQTVYSCAGELNKECPVFKILKIDFEQEQLETYKMEFDIEKKSFIIKNKNRTNLILKKDPVLDVTEEYCEVLDDLGMVLNHKKKSNLKLSDVYVVPNLARLDSKEVGKEINIKEDDYIDTFLNSKKYIILGESGSGKTSMLKNLYRLYIDNGYFPIYLKAEDIKQLNRVTSKKIDNLVYTKIIEQYGEEKIEIFKNFDKHKKVLFIDDYHQIIDNTENKYNLHRYINDIFGVITLTMNSFDGIQFDLNNNNILRTYDKYKIKKFSIKLRMKLVKKWYLINNYEYSDEDIQLKSEKAMRIIDNMLNNNNMPAIPYVILMMLSVQDSNNINRQDQTLYGHLLQMIITNSLLRSGVVSEDITETFVILDEIAYELFKSEKNNLQDYEFKKIIDEYNSNCDMDKDVNNVKEQLTNSNIMREEIIDQKNYTIRFKYAYLYSYFVAEYMAKHIMEDSILEDLKQIIDNIHVEINSRIFINVWYFREYFNKQENKLLELLEDKIKNTFFDLEPYEFEKPANCIANIINNKSQILMEFKPITEEIDKHKEDIIEKKDEIENKKDVNCYSYNEDINTESKEVAEIITATNLILTIGQIVKSSSGAFDSETKRRLIENCYNCGMKLLKNFYNMFDESMDSFKQCLQDIMDENTEITLDDAYHKALSFVQGMIQIGTYSILYQISDSISQDKIKISFKRIVKEQKKLGYNLINVMITFLFNHNEDYGVVKDFLKKDEGNDYFIRSIMRIIIWQYYYYNKSKDRVTRQKLLQEFHLKEKKLIQ